MIAHCPEKLNAEMIVLNSRKTIYNWSQTWQIHLNTSKCKSLCISNKRIPPFHTHSINNVSVKWVNQFKYLGLCINRNLTWGSHTAASVHKASHMLNLLKRTMYSCNKTSKKLSVAALVRLHIEYCAPVWNPHCAKDKLLLKVSRSMLVIGYAPNCTVLITKGNKFYDQVLDEPTILQHHTILGCCQTYKGINSLDCIDFHQCYRCVSRNSRCHTLALSHVQFRVNSY